MNRLKSYLIKEDHIPVRARFPVIDAHNHLWGSRELGPVVETMDAVGVSAFCDLTGNVEISFAKGGYTLAPGDIDDFFQSAEKYPGRFYCFTMAAFAKDPAVPLFEDHRQFVSECIALLRAHVKKGAKGLKILKELGLIHRDASGELVNLDDPGLGPIWEEAGKLGIPVLIHQSDPDGFFDPVEDHTEHSETMKKYPSWSFANPEFPRKAELIKRRDNLLKQHQATTFILPHVANMATDLGAVSKLLRENPNVYVDFSARVDELGRQPYSARKFFMEFQDRIIFGVDMPANIESSREIYRTCFRFLETWDEAFFAPDYDGTFSRARWPIYGIGLPDEVLEKIYNKNILNLIPSLRE